MTFVPSVHHRRRAKKDVGYASPEGDWPHRVQAQDFEHEEIDRIVVHLFD